VDNRRRRTNITPNSLGDEMPRRKRPDQLTPVELEIMQVLWELGAAPVQAVQERLGGGVAYTTVQTMLNVLVRKGKVKRTLVDRAYRYRPGITRGEARGAAVRAVVAGRYGG